MATTGEPYIELTESHYYILRNDGEFVMFRAIPLIGESMLWGE